VNSYPRAGEAVVFDVGETLVPCLRELSGRGLDEIPLLI